MAGRLARMAVQQGYQAILGGASRHCASRACELYARRRGSALRSPLSSPKKDAVPGLEDTAMSLTAFLAFAGIYALAVLTPGPGVAAVLARALASGVRGTFPFIMGMALGDLVWLNFAVFGLAALAQMLHGVFVALKYAGAAYLLFMAWKLWTAKSGAPHEHQEGAASGSGLRLVAAGLSMTLGNPKTMLFFLAVLPHVLNLGGLGPTTLAGLSLVMSVIPDARDVGLCARRRARTSSHP
jgi:threonine/homoserine/homoserine lactone efflux protein